MNYRLEFLKRNAEFKKDLEELKRLVLKERQLLEDWTQSDAEARRNLQEESSSEDDHTRHMDVAEGIESEHLGEDYDVVDRRIRSLLWKLERTWGLKLGFSRDEIVSGEVLPPDALYAPAAVMTTKFGVEDTEDRYAPEEFRARILSRFSTITDYLRGLHPGATATEIADIVIQDDSPIYGAPESVKGFWKSVDKYMDERMIFFWGYWPNPFHGVDEEIEQSGLDRDVAIRRRFLLQRHLNPWISVQIDTSRPKGDIVDDVKRIIDTAHGLLKIEGVRTRTPKMNEPLFDDYIKIYDLKEKGRNFRQIAEELYPEEYADEAGQPRLIDKVRDRYSSAKRLIENLSTASSGMKSSRDDERRILCRGCPSKGHCDPYSCKALLDELPPEEITDYREVLSDEPQRFVDPASKVDFTNPKKAAERSDDD
jgi:hypothetical protein